MSIPTEVEAQVEVDGRVKVISFTWRGQQRQVIGQGRQWVQAGRRHILVMAAGDRVFELAWEVSAWTWMIVREPQGDAPRA